MATLLPAVGNDGTASADRAPFLFGIIGTGEIVRMILPTLQRDAGLRVIAVAGTNARAAADLGKEFGGASVCHDYRELLKLQLDAVYIATPPHLHREMIEASLKAGKHVVCEKPLIMNLAELRRIAAVLRSHPELKLASCSSRFHACPPVRKAREMIARGRLGKILTVRLNNSVEFPLPFSALPAWKRQRSTSGGGLVMDWGVYDLDWLQFLLGDLFAPTSVMGSVNYWRDEGSGLETTYAVQLRCGDGLTISLERRPEHGPQFQRVEIRGSEGGLDLPFMPGAQNENLLWHHRVDNLTLRTETLPEKMNDWGTILAYPVIDAASALAEQREVASPFSIQEKIYGVITALYESSVTGSSVTVPKLSNER